MATSMKIGAEDASGYADGSNFTFPRNPILLSVDMDTQRTIRVLAHQQIHMLVDQGGLKPRGFVLSGAFAGASKRDDMNTLMSHVFAAGMKRFYYTSDRFFWCFGARLGTQFQGSRTNFQDYGMALITPIPFSYDDTLATETWNISNATATTINSGNDSGASEGAFKNDGAAPAHILEWTITRGGGGSNITKVEIGDSAVSGGAAAGNVITWNGTLEAGEVLKIFLFKVVATSGVRMFKKLYYTVDGTLSGTRDFDGSEPPFIVAGAANQSFSVKLTGNNTSTAVKADWRDTYWL